MSNFYLSSLAIDVIQTANYLSNIYFVFAV